MARLCRKLDVPHRTLRWSGAQAEDRPAGRRAPRALRSAGARKRRVTARVTCSPRIRSTTRPRPSCFGCRAAAACRALRRWRAKASCYGVTIVRPLLDVAKARLIATLAKARIPFADDPSNRDPRFTRPRWRADHAGCWRKEGLSAQRLALLARRIRRAEAALAAAVTKAAKDLSRGQALGRGHAHRIRRGRIFPAAGGGRLCGCSAAPSAMPATKVRSNSAKLEALHAALRARQGGDSPLRRTLAGAMVTCERGLIVVERAPPRRTAAGQDVRPPDFRLNQARTWRGSDAAKLG